MPGAARFGFGCITRGGFFCRQSFRFRFHVDVFKAFVVQVNVVQVNVVQRQCQPVVEVGGESQAFVIEVLWQRQTIIFKDFRFGHRDTE